METMYTTGLNIHYFGVVMLLGIISFNATLLLFSKDIILYAKRMRIAMPLSAIFIALILFTGSVMMAAKNLSFTLPNSVMIVIGIVMIILEAKRYKTLKRKTDISMSNAFEIYKQKAFKFLGIEFFLVLFMMVWMLIK